MATPDSVNTTDAKVVITLAARAPGPNFVQPERRLTFTRENPSIPIGRASKVATKGFVAAADNAWFESPVMSRDHAELVADFDASPKTIFVKDVGSLHGTFHRRNDGTEKEARLEHGKPVRLNSGDTLRFGIDIYRSKETFPPCSVDFLIEELMESQNPTQPQPSQAQPSEGEAARTRGFSVYDIDDVEDDDISCMSDASGDESVFETQKPSLQSGDLSRSIDLTGDVVDLTSSGPSDRLTLAPSVTAHLNIDSNVIDLTSESEHNAYVEPILDDTVIGFASLPRKADTTLDIYSSAPLQEPETENEDTADDRIAFSERLQSEDIDIRLTDSDDSALSGDSADEMSDDDNSISGCSSGSSELGDEYEASDNFEDEDEEEAEHGIAYWDDSTSNSSGEAEDSIFHRRPSPLLDSVPSSPSVLEPKEPAQVALFAPESTCDQTVGIQPSPVPMSSMLQGPFVQARQPSPSDAAMVKVHPSPSWEASASQGTAQTLGEKTGKFEFFAAREENRAAVMGSSSSPPISAIRETLRSQSSGHEIANDATPSAPSPTLARIEQAPHTSTVLSKTPGSQAPQSVQSTDKADAASKVPGASKDSAWSTSGHEFINSPDSVRPVSPIERTRFQSPELDMTSAYSFQQSKLAKELKGSPSVRRLPIQDLIDQDPKDSSDNSDKPTLPKVFISDLPKTDKGSKRSFEQAFVDEDTTTYAYKRTDDICVRSADAANAFAHQPPFIQEPDASSILYQAPASSLQKTAAAPAVSASPHAHESRPAKRRRFAEVAACVALGGAGVLSALIMSAPSFA